MDFSWLSTKITMVKWQNLGYTALDTLIYLVVLLILARVSYSIIIFLLRRLLVERKGQVLLEERKANTLFSLLRSICFYLITFVLILQILKRVFNFDTTTILASASVLGVALGFGSQSLVKDMIAGFFILFENQFAVGDYVKIGEFVGNIEETGIRTTRIRAWGGELHIIPNGSISAVTNYSRGKMLANVEIKIPYEEDLERAMDVLRSVCSQVSEEYGEKIVEEPTVQGITQFGERNVVLRVVAFTKPDEQWGLERELRRRIHSAFLKEGIRTPQFSSVIVKDPAGEPAKPEKKPPKPGE